MNVQADNHTPTSIITKPLSSSLWNKIKRKYEDIQIPFSERRVLLVTMDGLLVLLAATLAFIPWQLKAGKFFDVDSLDTRIDFESMQLVGFGLAQRSLRYSVVS